MKFYDKYYACNYDELITYYPRFYQDVYEMREILKAHGRIADELEANVEQTFFNASIDYADEAAITRLENFLHIYSTKGRTLKERKRFLKSFLIGFGKISASLICQMISAYTNAPVSCRFEPFDKKGNNLLYIDFERRNADTIYMSDILMLLARKLPAHIEYRPEIVYRFPIVIGRKRTHIKYEYDFSGTKPDTALYGAAITRDTVTSQSHKNFKPDHMPADDKFQTGLYPSTATPAAYVSKDIATTQKHETNVFLYEETNKSKNTGRHPHAAYLGQAEKTALGIGYAHINNITDYDSTGTKPDDALLGDLKITESVVEKRKTDNIIEHDISGTIPEPALPGLAIRKDAVTKQEHDSTITEYTPANKNGEPVGRFPNGVTQANLFSRDSVISEKLETSIFGYEETNSESTAGTNPESVTTGGKHVIDATTGAAATEYSVNYNPCGTTFTQE